MNSVRFGEKLITPSKLLCIGRNYVAHINELNNTIPEQMVVFNKPNSCITSTLSSFHQERLHYEVEICFLIETPIGSFSVFFFLSLFCICVCANFMFYEFGYGKIMVPHFHDQL